MKKFISIIMPVYNAEKYLVKAIKSVQNQTFKEFELILVDDGSTDGSPKICDHFSMQDERIHVVHKVNGGICAARNTGLSQAQGEYVGFMDNDDYLDPNLLKDNYELLIDNKADWVKFGKTEVLIQNQKILTTKQTQFKDAVYEGENIIQNIMQLRAEDVMTFVWDSLFRRDILLANEVHFDEKFRLGNEDIDFCEQYAAYCKKLVVNSKGYYTHYTRIGISASSKYSKEKMESYLYLLKKSNERYIRYGLDIRSIKNDYVYVITKQILANSCQKLNDAGELITKNEKIRILKQIKESPEFIYYKSFKNNDLAKRSMKLYIYDRLFRIDFYNTLLLIDKYSRRLIYFIRANKSKLTIA